MRKDYGKYIDDETAFQSLKTAIEKGLRRSINEEEESRLYWLSCWEGETVGVFVDMFEEIARKSNAGTFK